MTLQKRFQIEFRNGFVEMKREVWKTQMKIDEISYLPSLILNNTPITRLDKEHVLKTSTACDTGQSNGVLHNGRWSKLNVILWTIFISLRLRSISSNNYRI